jgi:hypothetical protein
MINIKCKLRRRSITIIIFLSAIFYGSLAAQNPFLPPTAFIPDGEPHVFEFKGEKRVFIYGSRDELVTAFCGYGHDVWSAPITNLSKWTNHGEIFNVKQAWDTGFGIVEGQTFGAPDCVYNPITKKYYLYTFFLKDYKMDGKEGPLPGAPNYIEGFDENGPLCVMAVSDSPVGPFTNPVICDWPPANKVGTFDPSVLVMEKEDGSVRVYAFWGMKHGDRWAELDPNDMHTIIDPQTRKPFVDRRTKRANRNATYKTLNNPAQNEYSTLFEASSIKQISKDKFVFVYSANERMCALSYCYSNSPEGPWTYGGKIIDNGKDWAFGNNHGSIFEANGKWYVVYHKKTYNDYNRQAMIEPIQVSVDGDKVIIPEVEMTSQGIFSQGLDAFRRYNINSMCYRTNTAYIDGAKRYPDGLNPLVGIDQKNTVVGFKYLNFGTTKITDKDKLKLRLNAMMIDSDATVTIQVTFMSDVNDASKRVSLGTLKLGDFIKADGSYHEIAFPINGLDKNTALVSIGGLNGKLAVFLLFNDNLSETCRLKEFEFAKGDTPTPNPLRPIKVDGKLRNGSVTALPIMGRGGESVKLSVVPQKGYLLKELILKDKKGHLININKNGITPYAQESFNFEMPEGPVFVSAIFSPIIK